MKGRVQMDAEQIDSLILETLCEVPGPWTTCDLIREIGGGEGGRRDRRVVASGLALRMEGDFIVASAAGRYANAVAEKRP